MDLLSFDNIREQQVESVKKLAHDMQQCNDFQSLKNVAEMVKELGEAIEAYSDKQIRN